MKLASQTRAMNSMFNNESSRAIVGVDDDIIAAKRSKMDTDPLGVAMNSLK